MPFKLHTAKGRKGEPYQKASTAIGSWNADLPYGSLPFGQCSELKNYRKSNPTEIEVRSGYKTWTKDGNFIPMAETEYRLNDDFRDVAFYHDAGSLVVLVLNTITGAQYSATVIASGITTESKAHAQQFGTYLVFGVLGIGEFVLQPLATDLLTWSAPIPLGKVLAMPPNQIRFPDTITGDLIVFDMTHTGEGDNRGFGQIVLSQNFAIGEKEPTKIPVDLEATYYQLDTAVSDATFTDSLAASIHTIADTKLFGRWRFGKDDNAGLLSSLVRTPELSNHIRHNGWGYKIVYVHERTDVKGQKFTHRSNPSVDFWVGDKIYIPAHTLQQHVDFVPPEATAMHYPVLLFAPQVGSGPHYQIYPPDGFDFEQHLLRVPTREAVQALQGLWKKFFHDSGSGGTGTNDPYLGAAIWLMWDTLDDARFDGPAYKVEVPVSELKGAPMAEFRWSDFTVPDDVVAIEIYRTAYAQPDDKDNATLSPEFQPYRYGLVGSLKKDSKFTDDVAIPDFGTSPDRYIGFLSDQFSAAEITVHNEDNVVLGNLETKYYVHAPALVKVVNTAGAEIGSGQAFAYTGNTTDGFHLAELTSGEVKLYLQYVDADGNKSNPAEISIDLSNVTTDSLYVAVVPPRGYFTDITTINLLQGNWNASLSIREYRLIESQSLPAGIMTGKRVSTAIIADVTKTIVTSKDSGSIIYDEPHDLFVWPQENFILIHQNAPVTGFGVTIGMLTVFLDSATWATDLGTRTEVKSKEIGLISRWACGNIQKLPYFLSAGGLYASEPSGVRKIETDVESEVLKYLREEIPGVAPLANARRASMKGLAQRDELWLYFPSSYDLWLAATNAATAAANALSARCFVYKIPTMRTVLSYEFELATNPNPSGRVIFSEHSDRKLFCSYFDGTRLVIQDNDVEADWDGKAYFELMLGLGKPEEKKALRGVTLSGDIHAKISRITGMPRADGLRTALYGALYTDASLGELRITKPLYFNCAGSVKNVFGYSPAIRFITEPNTSGEHHASFSSIDVMYFSKHKHPQ